MAASSCRRRATARCACWWSTSLRPGRITGLRALRARRRRGGASPRARPDQAGQLLGRGHLAMTIDQGPEMSRYQGLVALDGRRASSDAAHEYFLRSEQIPTRVRLAVAEELRRRRRPAPALARRRHPAAVPAQVDRADARQPDLDPGDAPAGMEPHVMPEDDAWVEGRSLIETVDDIELIDPDAFERAARLPAVPRTRRAGLQAVRSRRSARAPAPACPAC